MEIKRKRGFSMVELLTVMGIMVILAAIGIPSYIAARNRYIMDGQANKMVALFREGLDRAKSQQDGVDWGIGINNGASDWYELLSGGVGGTSVNRVYLDSSVAFTDPTTSTSTTFHGGPSITVLDSNLTVGIVSQNNSEFTDTIIIDTLGRVSRTSSYE
jgi:prepilin-type N-terminal cleavage/methylation domain-containing protein